MTTSPCARRCLATSSPEIQDLRARAELDSAARPALIEYFMDASGKEDANRAYYDAFSSRYEAHRGGNDPGGYHDLLDELESDFVQRFAEGKDVLEVGCGTGLVLGRIVRFARTAKGVDLSPGMLERARARGLDVSRGSATALPFDDQSFDVTCSFKVLAHVPEVNVALGEMARVTRTGGTILAEFYNPFSMRGLVKRLGPAGKVAEATNERQVFTRYDSPWRVQKLVPPGCTMVASRGIRIATPSAIFMRIPGIGSLLRRAEWALCDSALAVFGGFFIAAMKKES